MTRADLKHRSSWLKCNTSFQDFNAGEMYWLEVIENDNDDMYCVRSDNLLGRYYKFSEDELTNNFSEGID